MRSAGAVFVGMIPVACALTSIPILGGWESARELELQNQMIRQEWMLAVRPFAIDKTATALFHGDRGLSDGNVIDENGRPVGGATVWTEPLGRPLSTPIPQGLTNESGRFAIEIIPDWFGRMCCIYGISNRANVLWFCWSAWFDWPSSTSTNHKKEWETVDATHPYLSGGQHFTLIPGEDGTDYATAVVLRQKKRIDTCPCQNCDRSTEEMGRS